MESMSCPLTPKSQSLISPREFTRMLEGLTSVGKRKQKSRELTQVGWEGEGQRSPDRPALTTNATTHPSPHHRASPWLRSTGHQGPLFPFVQGSRKGCQQRNDKLL